MSTGPANTNQAVAFLKISREALGVVSDLASVVGIPVAIFLFSKSALRTNAGRDELASLWIYGAAIGGLIYSLFAISYFYYCHKHNSYHPRADMLVLAIPVVLFAVGVISLYLYAWPF